MQPGGQIGTSNPPEPFSWARIARTLTFWAVLVIGTIVLVQYATERRRDSLEVSYNEFVQQLQQHNIVSIQVSSRRVRGESKAPVRVGEQSSSHFVTTLPFEPSESWTAALVEKGVEIRGDEPIRRRSWPVIVLTFVPYVLILFVVIWTLRQLQAHRRRDQP